MTTFKVSAKSNAHKVAGAMAAVLKDAKQIELVAVGAQAVNQATKAIITARKFMAESGIDLVCTPSFVNLDNDIVGVNLMIESKKLKKAG